MVKNAMQRVFGVVVLLGLLLALPLGASLAQSVVPPANAVGSIELVGLIEAMTVDSITVNQQVIDITSAELTTALELDAAVKVEGWVLTDGTIAAREVSAATPDGLLPGEVEITGVVEAVDATTLTVNGLVIDISTAEMTDVIAVGDMVKVHASFDDAGALVAREVALYTPDTPPATPGEDFELRGTLEEVGDGYIVVAGQSINMLQAEVKTQLQVGALVKVHVRIVNGELVASEVEGWLNHDDNANTNDNSNDNEDDDDNSNDNGAVVIPADCVPAMPSGWTTYTIQAGDTLSAIAAGSGSSISELAVTNCIRDPRFIVVGMTIFVPQTPDPAFFNNNDNHDDGEYNDDHSNDNGSDDDHNDDRRNDNHDDDHEDDNDNHNDNDD